jgi:glycosyltransferase involved in cell wall biosynthesis
MSNSPVLFTFVVPTYNRANKIYNTLTSIIEQSYRFFEIVIVDDASTDNTKEVVSQWTEKQTCPVQYIRLEKNSGPNVAKNAGAKISKGSWLVFLDSDDLIKEGCLEYLNDFISKNNDASLIMVPCVNLDGEITNTNPGYEGYVSFRDYLRGRFTGEYLPVAKKDVFNKFQFLENLRGGEGITWLQMSKACRMYIVAYSGRVYDNHGVDRLSYKSADFIERVLTCHSAQLEFFYNDYWHYSKKQFVSLHMKRLYYFSRFFLKKLLAR